MIVFYNYTFVTSSPKLAGKCSVRWWTDENLTILVLYSTVPSLSRTEYKKYFEQWLVSIRYTVSWMFCSKLNSQCVGRLSKKICVCFKIQIKMFQTLSQQSDAIICHKPSENSWSGGAPASSKVMFGRFLKSRTEEGWVSSSPPIIIKP